jgi:hypothetical protein
MFLKAIRVEFELVGVSSKWCPQKEELEQEEESLPVDGLILACDSAMLTWCCARAGHLFRLLDNC